MDRAAAKLGKVGENDRVATVELAFDPPSDRSRMSEAALLTLAITFVLPAWQSDVPSVWHALRIRRTGVSFAPER